MNESGVGKAGTGISKATVALALAKGFGAGMLFTGVLIVAQGRVKPAPAKPAPSVHATAAPKGASPHADAGGAKDGVYEGLPVR